MLKLKLKLDGKITSVNKTYMRGRYGGTYLAPEVKAYREEVFPVVQAAHKKSKTKYTDGYLVVKIQVYTKFFTKAGGIRRLDIDNFAKNVIDAIFPPLEVDDKAIFDLQLKKVHYEGNPYITVSIEEKSFAS